MAKHSVHVPVALLLDPAQTAAAKVLWMVRRLHPAASPAELEAHAGLSRHTVRDGLAAQASSRPGRPPGGPRVQVPGALLADRTLGARAKVLYGLLQATPGFQGHWGRFTYAALCAQTGLSRNALKAAAADLTGAGWLKLSQKNRLSPIRFSLGSPAWRRSLAEATAARRRLDRLKYTGEAIMQGFLSLLVESEEYFDNARPGFLTSPLSSERLELDRFYPQQNVGFEYHGAQHFGQTDKFSQAEAEAQHLRDVIKAGLCVYAGVHLVIITAADLSLQGMIRKVRGVLPLRDLAGHELLIDVLEDASLTYIANTPTAR